MRLRVVPLIAILPLVCACQTPEHDWSLVVPAGARMAEAVDVSERQPSRILFENGFESGDFRGWSFVQALDPRQGPGHPGNRVGTADTLGVQPHSGRYAARFERPAWATDLPHAKVYKEWSSIGKRDQFGRRIAPLPGGGDPSGTYSAWFHLPPAYQADRSWVNVFQFKEQGRHAGSWRQDPSWWLNIAPASRWGQGGSEPVIFANHWDNGWGYTPQTLKLPLGRWFEIRAELHEGDRIEWYVDGTLLDVSRHATYPVGRFFDQSEGWVFGVGHYYGVGHLFVDDVAAAFPAALPRVPRRHRGIAKTMDVGFVSARQPRGGGIAIGPQDRS